MSLMLNADLGETVDSGLVGAFTRPALPVATMPVIT